MPTPLVVPKAVLDADNNPAHDNVSIVARVSSDEAPVESWKSYHKLVNTTPKPSATKNSSGELVGPLELSLLLLPVGLGVLVEDEVVVAIVARLGRSHSGGGR